MFVRRTLQLEGITSLKIAIERAKTIKVIQGETFGKKRFDNFANKSSNGKFYRKNEDGEKKEEKEGTTKRENNERGNRKPRTMRECWLCGKTGHFRSECPDNKGNGI